MALGPRGVAASLGQPAEVGNLIPAPELQASGWRRGVDEHCFAEPAQVVRAGKRSPGSLFGRARIARFAVLHSVGARLVADGAAELLQRGEVALAGEQQPGPAVVPDRSCLLSAVAGLDLGE